MTISLEPIQLRQMGFSEISFPLPTQNKGEFALIGFSADHTEVKVSKDCYMLKGNRVVASSKTYNHFGNIIGLDANYIHKFPHHRPDDVEQVGVGFALIEKELREIFPQQVFGKFDLPKKFSIINEALRYLRSSKTDHARLILRWHWLFPNFKENPEILDLAVKGHSLWELLPKSVETEVVVEMRKLKNFDDTWVNNGLKPWTFVKKLVHSCSYLKNGAPRPASAREAWTLIELVEVLSEVLRSLPLKARESIIEQFVERKENWRSIGKEIGPYSRYFDNSAYRLYMRHYIEYIANQFFAPGFRLANNWNQEPHHWVDAFTAFIGYDKRHLYNSTYSWHERTFHLFSRTHSEGASSWSPAFGEVIAPNGLKILELKDAEALREEGRQQSHCVYHHRRTCSLGDMRIASVREKTTEGEKTLSTFSMYLQDGKVLIEEHRARFNKDPSMDAIQAVAWFEEEVNLPSPSFQFNKCWTSIVAEAPEADERQIFATRINEDRELFPKKTQKWDVEAFLAVFSNHTDIS